jgi:hypothetical protein
MKEVVFTIPMDGDINEIEAYLCSLWLDGVIKELNIRPMDYSWEYEWSIGVFSAN